MKWSAFPYGGITVWRLQIHAMNQGMKFLGGRRCEGGECMADGGEAVVVNQLRYFITGELMNAGKGRSVFIQTAQRFKFPRQLADAGLF